MAATLMMIKSRMLLPVEERPELEEEEEDPRWELVRQLVEYKKFKDAASHLQEKEIEQENMFDRGGELPAFEPEPGVILRDVSIFDLLAAFSEALKRAPEETFGEIFDERFTVADKIAAILSAVREMTTVSFLSLFGAGASRPEMICTFIALLELIRLRQVVVRQEVNYGDIVIMQAAADAA
jgi:segregation and condensation protein A